MKWSRRVVTLRGFTPLGLVTLTTPGLDTGSGNLQPNNGGVAERIFRALLSNIEIELCGTMNMGPSLVAGHVGKVRRRI